MKPTAVTARQRSLKAKHGAEHRHMVNRLLQHFVAADGDTYFAGKNWYPQAERLVQARAATYGVSIQDTAGIFAVLSPQKRWRENILLADAALRGGHPGNVLGASWRKAMRIRNGEDPFNVVSGPKVTSFFANLLGNRDAVTVDVWAQRAATGKLLDAPKGARYCRLADAYSSAAEIVGESPRDFQAIIWLAVRPPSEHAKDMAQVWEMT